MTRIKWWRGIIFYAELNSSSRRLTCDLRDDAKPEVDTRRHTTPSNHIAIFHDSGLFMGGSDERQKISICPVRGSPSSLKQSGHTQNEGTGAHRRDVLCSSRLLTDEFDGRTIIDNAGHAFASPRYANQVERRTALERMGRHETESAIARDGRHCFRDNVGRRLRKPREHLKRTREIQLRQTWEDDKANVEKRHV